MRRSVPQTEVWEHATLILIVLCEKKVNSISFRFNQNICIHHEVALIVERHKNFYVYNCRLQVCRCRLQSTKIFTLNFTPSISAGRCIACPLLRRRLPHHPNPDLAGDQLQRLAVHDVLVSIGKPKSTSIFTSTT